MSTVSIDVGVRPGYGTVRFVPAAQIADVCAALVRARFFVAAVTTVEPARGSLGVAIDDAVEGSLAMRGALPPGVDVDAEPHEQIRDRVLRVRALDRAGLAVAMPSLSALADPHGRLDPADGAALLAWIEASRSMPIVLVLDEADAGVSLLAPVSLASLIQSGAVVSGVVRGESQEPASPRTCAPVEVCDPASGIGAEPVETSGRKDEAASAPDEPRVVERPASDVEHEAKPAADREASARRILSSAEWRAYAVDLDAARGPKPVRDLCALFATRYVPLLGAVARGEVDHAVRGVVDAWRTTFEHSYTESSTALRVTGKRPPMVLDVPDLAARIGRQSGARMIKLLLVDSMSLDLGERVVARLSRALAGRALCTERMIVWAALPTTTPTQMALLARGPDGLRDAPPSDREPDVARGRAVSMLRRDRAGSREIMKLDLVEARLRGPGPAWDERLDAIADEVEDVIVRYVETLPVRTLLAIFGDHGFRMTASADGTTTAPATQGGASPEEVLVPATFWLVGGVH